MQKTLSKISKAIELIKSKNLAKKGRNEFSNYDYYTPEQVAELVTGVTHEVKLITKFDLIRNELGITGRLSVYDLESDEQPVIYDMASAIPEIKATNISQQLGGAMTYTKRYLLMNAFDITDNNLDFDTTENTQKTQQPAKNTATKAPVLGIEKAIAACNTQKGLTDLFRNNKELQASASFIKLLADRKKVLIENGITE